MQFWILLFITKNNEVQPTHIVVTGKKDKIHKTFHTTVTLLVHDQWTHRWESSYVSTPLYIPGSGCYICRWNPRSAYKEHSWTYNWKSSMYVRRLQVNWHRLYIRVLNTCKILRCISHIASWRQMQNVHSVFVQWKTTLLQPGRATRMWTDRTTYGYARLS